MAYELWQPLFAGLFLFIAGGTQVFAPYQAARKAAMESGNEADVAEEWEIDVAQIAGGVTALVGLAILVRAGVRVTL
ncbi:hypothetical protein JCM30237_28300 [Halolamina litorea]|uniref:Uncharacterized protein n=1 Tax=Halolamina litorea TaxID=1515593 RepID=A0ABD6BU10_9EURY|nr:hypothetical protein [Halolamina litorea]